MCREGCKIFQKPLEIKKATMNQMKGINLMSALVGVVPTTPGVSTPSGAHQVCNSGLQLFSNPVRLCRAWSSWSL